MRLPLTRIKVPPDYKRSDLSTITTLAADIQRNGLSNPIKVAENGDGYVLIDGRRRLIAVRRLGLSDIPAEVVTDDLPPQVTAMNSARLLAKQQRQAKVREMLEAGAGVSDIAIELGNSRSTIQTDVNEMGLQGMAPRSGKWHRERSEARLRRQEQVRDLLINRGMGPREIANELDVNSSTVQRDIADLGLQGVAPKSHPKEETPIRRRSIVQMWESGFSMTDIAEQTGIGISAVSDHLTAAGVRPKGRSERRPTVASILDNMATLVQGLHALDNYDLNGFRFDPEAAKAWERDLSEAVKALNRVRKHLKGST